MQTTRKSKVITSSYTLELYDYGKLFVNTNSDVTVTLPTPDDDLDIYIKNLGTGTVTVEKTNGIPTATRSNRKIDGANYVEVYQNDCYLLSYVKELDAFYIIWVTLVDKA